MADPTALDTFNEIDASLPGYYFSIIGYEAYFAVTEWCLMYCNTNKRSKSAGKEIPPCWRIQKAKRYNAYTQFDMWLGDRRDYVRFLLSFPTQIASGKIIPVFSTDVG